MVVLKEKYTRLNTRIEDLLNSFKLIDRVYSGSNNLEEKIDYSFVDNIIWDFKEETINYFDELEINHE